MGRDTKLFNVQHTGTALRTNPHCVVVQPQGMPSVLRIECARVQLARSVAGVHPCVFQVERWDSTIATFFGKVHQTSCEITTEPTSSTVQVAARRRRLVRM